MGSWGGHCHIGRSHKQPSERLHGEELRPSSEPSEGPGLGAGRPAPVGPSNDGSPANIQTGNLMGDLCQTHPVTDTQKPRGDVGCLKPLRSEVICEAG